MAPRLIPQHNHSCEEATPLFTSANPPIIAIDVVTTSPAATNSTTSLSAGVHYGGAAATTASYFLDFPPNDNRNSSISPSTSFRREAMMAFRQFSSRMNSIIEQHTGCIGNLGSFSIAVNSLTGPAMLTLPVTFVKSGLIPTIFTLLFVCFLSSFCCLNMANTISKVPGNANFKQEVEYSEAFRYFWGKKWNYITQVLFFVCVLCLEVSAIVDTAHVVDTFLGHWFPLGSFAYRVHPPSLFSTADPNTNTSDSGWEQWRFSECTNAQYNQGLCLPFRNAAEENETPAEQGLLFTLGMLITTLIFLPMALMDLKDNAAWQVVGFIVLLITSAQFMICFAMSDDLDVTRVPLWGNDRDDLLGVVLFNFALVIAIPAWLYEREPHVDVPTVVHGSNIISTVLYCGIGILGAMAMPNVSENMLESILSGALGPWMQVGASIFEFYIVGLSVPLYSVLNRLNIMANGVSMTTGNVLAVFLPFAMSWFLYDGGAVAKLLSWGGVIFTSMVAFILPISIALHVATKYDYDGSVVVYFGYIRTVEKEITTLRVMMVMATLAVILAVIGNFIPNEKSGI